MDINPVWYFRKVLVKINRILIRVLNGALFFLFAVLILIVAANVICRYVLKSPLFWVTELACYILVYLIFLGAALALYRGEHVRIYTEGMKMPSVCRNIFEKTAVLFNYLFIVLLIVFGMTVAVKNFKSYTGSLPIPMGYVYLAAPVSGIAMLLLYTERIFVKKKDE
ncbi:MAG: TRAP transporter small permease [Lachnospiraceae bacterium]|nr:TRAP transporter small permease [Lachnospiraceae bacterium]